MRVHSTYLFILTLPISFLSSLHPHLHKSLHHTAFIVPYTPLQSILSHRLCLLCLSNFRMASVAFVPSRGKPGIPSSHHHQSDSCTCHNGPFAVFSVLEHPTSCIHRSEDTDEIARVLGDRIQRPFPQVGLAPL